MYYYGMIMLTRISCRSRATKYHRSHLFDIFYIYFIIKIKEEYKH